MMMTEGTEAQQGRKGERDGKKERQVGSGGLFQPAKLKPVQGQHPSGRVCPQLLRGPTGPSGDCLSGLAEQGCYSHRDATGKGCCCSHRMLRSSFTFSLLLSIAPSLEPPSPTSLTAIPSFRMGLVEPHSLGNNKRLLFDPLPFSHSLKPLLHPQGQGKVNACPPALRPSIFFSILLLSSYLVTLLPSSWGGGCPTWVLARLWPTSHPYSAESLGYRAAPALGSAPWQ